MRNKENKLKRLADIVNSNDCELQSAQQDGQQRFSRPKPIESTHGLSIYATPSKAHRVCILKF